MTRILSVDDSKSIRAIVGKQCTQLGFTVDEAENGEEGLARLAENPYDLVVLDVTMPVMDGPEMLKRMREGGQKTPVLLLTSESKRSIVSDAMALGIDDYILKPFKPEEFSAKVLKSLKMGGPSASSQAVVQRASAMVETGGKQFVDVLLIDDMENVAKKMRTLLDAQVSMNSCLSAQSAFTQCREKIYNLILIDTEIPDVDTRTLIEQLKLLQPNAALIGLVLRTANDATAEMRALGFDSVLFKPFDKNEVDELLSRHFGSDEPMVRDDDVMKMLPFMGKDDRVDAYFAQLSRLTQPSLTQIAEACFEVAYLDITNAPAKTQELVRFIGAASAQAQKLGLSLSLLGGDNFKPIMAQFTETSTIPFYRSRKEVPE